MSAMKIHVLASGSGGNACVVEDGATMVLIDAGVSCGQINARMQHQGLDIQSLSACLVTHEHSDHVKGLRVLSKRYHVPVFMHPATQQASRSHLEGNETINYFELGETFQIGSLEITSVPTLHDAAAPTGFCITRNGVSVGYLTDLGAVTEDNFLMLRDVDHLVMEANHDRDMLWEGPYPGYLKARVDGRFGHLSNLDSAEFLRLLTNLGRLQAVTLAHLSAKNNRPELAHKAVANRQERDLIIRIAEQDRPLEAFTVEKS